MAYYGKLPIVLLSELAAGKEDTYNCRIAAYLLGRLGQSVSTEEIARACYVSKSAVSRFCREVGLEDFTELKELLAGSEHVFEPIGAELPPAQQAARVAALAGEAARQAAETLDLEALEELAREIVAAPRVACFGLLKAEAAAINLQSDLIMLGKEAVTKVSFREQLDFLAAAAPEDLAVIFSYRGVYFDYDLPAEARRGKGRIWLVTGDAVAARASRGAAERKILSFRSRLDFASHPYQLLAVPSVIAQRVAAALAEAGRASPDDER